MEADVGDESWTKESEEKKEPRETREKGEGGAGFVTYRWGESDLIWAGATVTEGWCVDGKVTERVLGGISK